jgi:hypothetical protein
MLSQKVAFLRPCSASRIFPGLPTNDAFITEIKGLLYLGH